MIDLLLVLVAFVGAFLVLRILTRWLASKTTEAPKASPADSPMFRTLLLVTPSDEIFTDAVKSVLIDTWGDLPVSELARKPMVELAFEFQATFPSPQYDDTARLKIAKTVHAILAGDDTSKPAEKPESPSSGSPRRQLEELAQRSKTVSGTNATVRGGIYHVLTVSGTNVTVQDAIVLGRCSVRGTNASGRVFAAPGVPVDVMGTNAEIDVVQLPWGELAERAAKYRRVE